MKKGRAAKKPPAADKPKAAKAVPIKQAKMAHRPKPE